METTNATPPASTVTNQPRLPTNQPTHTLTSVKTGRIQVCCRYASPVQSGNCCSQHSEPSRKLYQISGNDMPVGEPPMNGTANSGTKTKEIKNWYTEMQFAINPVSYTHLTLPTIYSV